MQPSPVVPPIWPMAGKADSFASGGDIWAHMKLGGAGGRNPSLWQGLGQEGQSCGQAVLGDRMARAFHDVPIGFKARPHQSVAGGGHFGEWDNLVAVAVHHQNRWLGAGLGRKAFRLQQLARNGDHSGDGFGATRGHVKAKHCTLRKAHQGHGLGAQAFVSQALINKLAQVLR